jgi:hypothetical protein|tara:strand:+ start:2844 stop:3017 length:174 start_codon:yes stop_codon:yes gene_type:complete
MEDRLINIEQKQDEIINTLNGIAEAFESLSNYQIVKSKNDVEKHKQIVDCLIELLKK